MSLIKEIQKILKEIEHIKQNNMTDKFQVASNSLNTSSIFAKMEVRKKSDSSLIQLDKNNDNISANFINKNKAKKEKRKIFRITYLRTAIPYLDLKSILNLSLLNKEFLHFIKSIYFYKFLENVKEYRTKKKINELILKNPKKTNIYSVGNTPNYNDQYTATKMVGSLFGAISGAFQVFGFGGKHENKPMNIDPKILEEKFILYEKILEKKLENAKINTELKEQRELINQLIEKRKMKIEMNNCDKLEEIKELSEKQSLAKKESILSNHRNSLGKLRSFIINDEEFEKIRREKLEKEYFNLNEEIKDLYEEDRILKNKIKMFENEDIEKVKILSNMKTLINSSSFIENLQITEKDNFKSGKNEELKIYNNYN